MDQDLLFKALEALKHGQKYAFATVVQTTKKGTPRKSGAKMIVLEDGSIFGSIGGGRNEKAAQAECLKAIKSNKDSLVSYDYFGKKGQSICGGQMKVFIEPSIEQRNLVICGAGHIALPLSIVAKILNYQVTIIDNRKEFANQKRFPHVNKILVGNHAKKLLKIPMNKNTHVMIVTQGNEYDFQCLKTIIQSEAGYIGVISSKPKRIKFFNRLKESGIPNKFLKRICIPAGIDLGSQTPAEIAISITAELVSLNNKELIGKDKFKVDL